MTLILYFNTKYVLWNEVSVPQPAYWNSTSDFNFYFLIGMSHFVQITIS